ncbi:Ger(x)C family spore germination protein [Neobacillus mesonae]|uniref:Ger(X)C family spore germination protein n=1 Tax=Neobacillus mesonae TaxID=1193713 RepID=A0A3T0HXT5_9BACI|nr:Ger(x)C family spore germination protein [Neobacillus mesonae]AZU61818.1 Ger(x)C family spore germination protein [Neobacillus mesonae]
MNRMYRALLLLVFVIPLLGGCWNQRELTDLAFVMAIGIDKGTGNEKFDVTFQVVVPANVSSGQNGGGGGQGPPVVVYKSTGNNITAASRKATKKIPREIYYSHTSIVIIGEELAREGIMDVLDGFDRDPEFRTTTAVIVAKERKAEDLISILTNLDKLPMNRFTKTLEATEAMLGENIKVTIDDLLEGVTSSGKEPVLSGFILEGSPEKGTSPQNINTTKPPAMITADGLAVMKDGKLAGWLTHNHVRGAVWLMNKMKGTDIDFNYNGKKDAISTTPYLSDTDIKITYKNGKPFANIKIETVFKLSEINTEFDNENPKKIDELEKLASAQIKKEVEDAIKQVQGYKADIFGFGERVHRSNPKLWKKIKADWNNQFASMDYHVEVNTFYRESGLRGKPFWTNLKK